MWLARKVLGVGQIIVCNFVLIIVDEMYKNIGIATHVHASRARSPPMSNGAHIALRGFLANGRLWEVWGVAPRHV